MRTFFLNILFILFLPVAIVTGQPVVSEVVINGTFETGATLTGGYHYEGEHPESGSAFRWFSATDNAGTGETLLPDATTVTYVILPEDSGKYFRFEVTPQDDQSVPGDPGTSTWNGPVKNAVPLVTEATIHGVFQTGGVLEGSYKYERTNYPESGSTFKWFRANDNGGGGEEEINETSVTYTIVPGDAGKYIRFVVTPVDDHSTPGNAITSSWAGPVQNLAPTASNAQINGNFSVGQIITASFDYADAENDPPGAHHYDWYRADDAAGTNEVPVISRTGDNTYLITNDDQGKYLKLVITPVASAGTAQGAVVIVWSPRINSAPSATGVTFGGAPLVIDQVITGTFTYNDADGDEPDGNLHLYTWYRADDNTGTHKTLIITKTGDNSLLLTAAEEGKYLQLEVTPAALSGTTPGLPVSSDWSERVNVRPIVRNIRVVGTQAVCKTLSGSYEYFDEEGDPEEGSTYRWFRAASPSGTKEVIAGATDLTYTLTTDDQGMYLYFEVTPRAQSGSLNGLPVIGTSSTGAIINSLPSVTLTVDKNTICQGASATLTMYFSKNPPFTFTYTDGLENHTIVSPDVVYQVNVSRGGTYKGLTLIDNQGCPVTSLPSTVTITVNPLPEVHIVGLNNVYSSQASAVPLQGTPTGGTFSGDGVVATSKMFYPGIAGVVDSPHAIVYSYTSPAGCSNSDTVMVSVIDAEAVISGVRSEAKYCNYDDTFRITGANLSGATGTFSISGETGLTNLGNNEATVTPSLLQAGTYTITYTYFNGVYLHVTQNITIDHYNAPVIFGLNEPVYCNNRSILQVSGNYNGVFTGSGIGKNADNTYYFDPATARPGRTPVYFTYTTSYGCKLSDSVILQVSDAPKARFEVLDRCWKGDSTTFLNYTTSSEAVNFWEWNFGDNLTPETKNKSNKFQPKHVYVASGDYAVSLVARNTVGCSDTVQQNIHLGDVPKADFSWDRECLSGNLVNFRNLSTASDQVSSYKWSIGDSVNAPITFGTKDISYGFPAAASYYVKMGLSTQTGCSDSITKTIHMRPVYTLTDTSYFNNFEQGRDFWQEENNTINNWKWGTPAGTIIAGAHSGTKAFYTAFGVAHKNEQLVVSSPCFDFTDVNKPFLEMWINRNTTTNQEGAVLQYKEDGVEGWSTIGTIGKGLNWYNDTILAAMPGGQKTGWSGTSGDWIRARNNLDVLSNLKNVRFRMVYGSTSLSAGKEGFAFDDVFISRREKTILFEQFTNMTSAAANLSNAIVDQLVNSPETDALAIQYHTSFPGTDTLNTKNQADPAARVLYYGVGSVPQCFLDGGVDGYVYDFINRLPNQGEANAQALKDADFEVIVSGNNASAQLSGTATVKALKDITTLEVNVYIAVVEDIKIQSGSGVTVYSNVLKKLLPSAAGTRIRMSWTKGQEYPISFVWTDPIVYDPMKVHIIAFVQNTATHEIYQATSIEAQPVTGIHDLPSSEASDAIIYPNPAQDIAHITFEKALSSGFELQLTDQRGKVIKQMSLEAGISSVEVDVSGISAGVYFVRLIQVKTGRQKVMKMVVIR